MEDNPDLKIITHHCGGMLPLVASRVAFTPSNSPFPKKHIEDQRHLPHNPLEYFHGFYCVTITSGSVAVLQCGYQFFGSDHLLFGTDAPMDNQGGIRQTEVSIRSIELLDISDEDKHKIFELNAIKLFRLPLSIVE